MTKIKTNQERRAPSLNGFIGLGGSLFLVCLAIAFSVLASTQLASGKTIGGLFFIPFFLFLGLGIFGFFGLRILKPKEALVLTLFGHYHGSLTKEGFYWINPFCSAVNPASGSHLPTDEETDGQRNQMMLKSKKMSLKTLTLSNGRQKINDALGNPINIGIVVIWRIEDTAKAAFNVDNYVTYLSTQADSALRSIVREYPYDGFNSDSEKSLQGSSKEVAERIGQELQSKVAIAGIEIIEARITHLAYAPEIASAMLQRQQASAIIDARAMLVDGAVGMVDMALKELAKANVVDLDEERRAQMVSNLLVVLCGNHDVHPVVNSGSLY